MLKKISFLLFIPFCFCSTPQPEEKEDQFSLHIRTSDPLSPEDERLAFKLPEGFKAQLFASEPDIGKPMNISFDPKGRMWVTQSNEYPFYDSAGVGPDRISILEDTDGDGRADKIQVFADSLNIPIGITPVVDGAIAYSIPYVYHLIDKDGDDKVDERKILLSGFEYKDTHGMINNFFRGLDGWIHADHGFSNVSKVVGTDNKEPLVMQSGNTFRFHPDGTGVEFTTTGRVNPFGYAMDEYGYMYSVDCHSSPIYQLIRGADYPHFGKQPTGIGFGPYMMRHEYGSTALAGLEYYAGEQFPEDYRQNFYLGDVVKCRVYRSSIKMNGTTPIPTWEPDFIVSDDPWFRPVDVKLGPDGALYIADFYNSIIGHYEVPLDHPARDKQRGRIWRITYEGSEDRHVATDWTKQDLAGLIKGLDDPSQTVRMMVADQIFDRFGQDAQAQIKTLVSSDNVSKEAFVHGMWLLFRLEALERDLLMKGLNHSAPEVKVHMLRILFELENPDPSVLASTKSMISDQNPHIVRATTMLLARHPREDQVRTFLDLLAKTPQEDSHLYYSIRQGLRDHMRDQSILKNVNQKKWNEQDFRYLADVMMGVDNSHAASFMLAHIQQYNESTDVRLKYTTHIARYIGSGEMDILVSTLRKQFSDDLDMQYQTFLALQRGVEQSGKNVSGEGKKWAISLAQAFLEDTSGNNNWAVIPLGKAFKANTWRYEEFEELGGKNVLIGSSRTQRNSNVSQLRSSSFTLPASLSFTLVGNKNAPGDGENASPPTNRIELFVDGKEKAERVIEITSPKQVEEISWDLGNLKGKTGYLILTDAALGWGEYIGICDVSASFPALPAMSPRMVAERQIFACEVAENFKVMAMTPRLIALLEDKSADVLVRAAAADALLINSPDKISVVGNVVANFDEPQLLQRRLIASLGAVQSAESQSIITSVLDSLSFDIQKEAVLLMSNNTGGIDVILNGAGQMDISPKILLDPQINERLSANMNKSQRETLAALTQNLTPFSEEVQKQVEDRIRNFSTQDVSVSVGKNVFQQNCAICHQIGGQGGNIGPQLDGIGNWGLQSLSEKILDPNRNISKAFVNYKIELKDGRIAQGLFRREEGKVKVFADISGNEFSYSSDEIKSMNALPFTLMPDNFSTVISEGDYYHLMSYLLSQN
ncbi:MAG: c-type cytochrome [Cyclobacteriaceae bacterium]|nr:c-type cytochrome [Cyclobacteriaceae bacterium SS2]